MIKNLLCGLAGLALLSGCSSVWTQYPPEPLRDGSSVQITTWKNQYQRDGIRIDRTTPDGEKSHYYLKRTPQDYQDYKVISQRKDRVVLRFFNDRGEAVFDREFLYSDFIKP